MDIIVVPPGTNVPEEYSSGMIILSDRPHEIKYLGEVKALIVDFTLKWEDVTPEKWPQGIRVIMTDRPDRIIPIRGGYDY